MHTETILYRVNGPIGEITLNRPDKLNSITADMVRGLHEALDKAEADASVRVVCLKANGRAFSSGFDLSEMEVDAPQARMRAVLQADFDIIMRFWNCPKPTLSAVQGYVLGGGFELAMACHLRIAADTAKVGQPEVNLGLVPGFGGTQRLLRLAGRSATLELCLLGQPIDAARAAQLGVLTRVVPADQLEAETTKLAEQLAQSAPQALRGVLDAVLLGGETSLEAGLDYETQVFALAFSTDDMKEGTSAFLARRKPTFTGR